MAQMSVGLIGLGTMGSALARNFASRGIRTVVYNRTEEKTRTFLRAYGHERLAGAETLKELTMELPPPRIVFLMVEARAVDEVLKDLLPFLQPNDIVVDGGNSHYRDTERRCAEFASIGISYVGCGISGGEAGALHGPSLMPGGSRESWAALRPMLQAIAARDAHGKPCVAHIGEGGAGHFVKMAHNGIEYGMMELLAESYDLLRRLYGLDAKDIANVFKKFNRGPLASYLMEIAAPVLEKKDGKQFLVDVIAPRAEQKGTGTWTVADALARGVAVPSIAAAVFARALSGVPRGKNVRRAVSAIDMPREAFVRLIERALLAAAISVLRQGYALMQKASDDEGWKLHLAEISRVLEGGCIIRSALMRTLHEEYSAKGGSAFGGKKPFDRMIKKTLPALRELICAATPSGIHIGAFTASLAYLDGTMSRDLPANLIQGMRDYFGAHGYERRDKPGVFHTEW
jgi:6-phosphogluconate dehydrogenase